MKTMKKNEEKVMTKIYERLELGRIRYGGDIPLNGERNRDNLKEAIEEALDLSIYTASLLLEEESHINKYKVAYHRLMHYWDQFDTDTKKNLDKQLGELGL
tara:strand:- start:311 stop:613 length:303 start_codon:yes stop_codon:yes gene_type:complete